MKAHSLSLICAVALTTASAQTTVVQTRPTSWIILSEGRFTPPIPLRSSVSSDFYKRWDASKQYYAYMAGVASNYLGYETRCDGNDLWFLPGTTESEFRQAEKKLAATFTSNIETFKKYLQKQYYPAKQVANNITASFYIYKPSVYSKPDFRHQYVHGYFFNSKLKQGVLLTCTFIPQKS